MITLLFIRSVASHCIHNKQFTRVSKTCVSSVLKPLTSPSIIFKNKMAFKVILAVALIFVLVEAQRPFYAGRRPIGYPSLASEPLSNRFGEDEGPILAQGDGNLINRFNQMPVDKQPFWYINWKAYDAQRKNPQTYPLRPNTFLNN